MVVLPIKWLSLLFVTTLVIVALAVAVPESIPISTIQDCHGKCSMTARKPRVPRSVHRCKKYFIGVQKTHDCMNKALQQLPRKVASDTINLLLSRNELSTLPDFAFSALSMLKTLDLSHNKLHEISANTFSGLNSLQTLLLQYNQLTHASEEIFIHLPLLTFLRIHGNPWACDCTLREMIWWLQLPGNHQMGSYATCSSPEHIVGTTLKQVQINILCENKVLPVYNHGSVLVGKKDEITKPPLALQRKLNTTVVGGYSIHGCLETLLVPMVNCHGKGLINVPGKLPWALISLDLSSNSIKLLRAKEFHSYKMLKSLNLRNNSLQSIRADAFFGLHMLEHMDMRDNKLQTLEFGTLQDMYALQTLLIEDNPWKCDYYIHYLVYWLRYHSNVVYGDPICAEPFEFHSWTLVNYMRHYYTGCQVQGSGIKRDGWTHHDMAPVERKRWNLP
uniref:leucine-rich repeat-containing protein 17-like n=1 Tax=Myxine glutinosa TaxID=7769 RepID=UPI00358FECCD